MSVVLYTPPEDGVAVLRLNRPEARNALNAELRALAAEHFERLHADPETKAIVLTGNEKCFAAGADVRDLLQKGAIGVMLSGNERLWNAMNRCAKPVIAAVNGFALGGGCELALHADIIVAGEGARFGQPEVKLGIMPGAGGTQRLTRAVGKYLAMKLCLTGELIPAQEALSHGMVSQVVPDALVLETALALARNIAAQAPLAVRQIKESIQLGMDASLPAALAMEMRSYQLLLASEDAKEGIAAFLEKRPPVYQGR